jgi:hypothetical protein
MIDLLGFGDPERWIIILLIILSLYFLWTNVENQVYNKRTKILLTIPRIYLIIYEVIIITDFYNVSRSIGEVFKTGYGGVIGILLLFAVETYVRWISKKYGRG